MKIAAISIADYAEATEGMPHDAERLFFRMLLKMYSREGGLPDDDADNARMFGYDSRRYLRLKNILLNFPCGMSIVGDEIRNSRIDCELPEIAERRKKLREAGALGGKSKRSRAEVEAKSGRSPIEVEAKSDRSTIASHIPPQAKSTTYAKLSPSPSPSPTNKESMHASFLDEVEEIRERLWSVAGHCMADDFQDLGIVRSWFRDGADAELILETIEAKAKNLRSESIEHYGYFNQPIREAIEDLNSGRPNRHVPEKELSEDEWFAMKLAQSGMEGELHGNS